MKTLVIKMNDLAVGANVYPVQLFFDDGKPGWLTRPLAAIDIPGDLSLLNPMLDPTNTPLNALKIREDFVQQPQIFVEWGRYLHQLLFQGALAQEWNRLHQIYPREVAGKSEGLRTILDIKPDTLRWLPWELIFQGNITWFFDTGNPFSRGSLEYPVLTNSFTWPIRALIVVGSKEDDKKVNAAEEIDHIQEAFIKSPVPIDWYVCYGPNKTELTDHIKTCKPQIFHFIGHGRDINNVAQLELNVIQKPNKPPQPSPQFWTVGDVPIDLQEWQPCLAFINACRSSSAAGQKNSWDIARAFSDAGVPAVVGMQADIRGDAAAEFAKKFYESLLGGMAIDRSLAEARAAVKNRLSLADRDWALATLYLRQVPEQIMNMKPVIEKRTIERYKSDSILKEIHDFVGRRIQRRELWHGVDQIEDYKDKFSNACIVVGPEQIGKSALVQASMKVCALRNRRICYVDIDVSYQNTRNFVEILKLMREGDARSSNICAPLPTEPFADFDIEYGPILAKPKADKILAADKNRCLQFFQAYKAALVAIAAKEPLIIVLDHLSVEWEQFKAFLVPELLVPIAQDPSLNCRLVLVCTTTEFDKLMTTDLKNVSSIINVGAWDPEKFVPLARQICLYNDIEINADVKAIIEGKQNQLKAQQKVFGPDKLRLMVKMLQ